MGLKLIEMSEEYRELLADMLDEWIDYNEHNDTNHSPWAIFKNDYHDFDKYVNNLSLKEARDGLVPDSTFFCLDEDRGILVGAVNIRHYLNDYLLQHGGHIGDGIRPSERRKGYATKMIGLALDKCKELGIDRVLMVCNKDNIGSAKSITSNSGVLENEFEEDGVIEQRYWIDLNKGEKENMKDCNCGYCAGGEPLAKFGIKICDLDVSQLVLFKEQSHKGRVIVAYKDHVSEIVDISDDERNRFFADVNKVAKVLHKLYQPDKVNYGAYGDTGCHLHMHLVPKYKDDFEWGGTFEMNPNKKYLTDEEYSVMIEEIRNAIAED